MSEVRRRCSPLWGCRGESCWIYCMFNPWQLHLLVVSIQLWNAECFWNVENDTINTKQRGIHQQIYFFVAAKIRTTSQIYLQISLLKNMTDSPPWGIALFVFHTMQQQCKCLFSWRNKCGSWCSCERSLKHIVKHECLFTSAAQWCWGYESIQNFACILLSYQHEWTAASFHQDSTRSKDQLSAGWSGIS